MNVTVFELNGQTVRAEDVDPHCTLLEWLRRSGRTGTKEGCAEGECGACAVAFVRRDADGRAYLQSVNSCLVPLPSVHGQTLVSVEGVARESGELHPVQQAMVEQGGSQCGYCTPGFVVSLFCEYYRPDRSGYDPEAISGNLCRCTGYRPIADVARSMPVPTDDDPWVRRLPTVPVELVPVDHHAGPYRFLRPTELGEALHLLQQHPEATLIAGGTDLMVYANQRYQRYSTLIALDALPELKKFGWGTREIVLGAGLSLSELEQRIHDADGLQEMGLLRQLFPLFSSRLIRNKATLGGNLITASPIGDSPPVLLALEAELTLCGPAGLRRVPLDGFFLGYRKPALQPGELVVSVHVPRPLARVQRFYKASKRMLDDISTVAAAFCLDLDDAGNVARLRVAYGGVAATPLRAHEAEQIALGKPWNPHTLGQLLAALAALGTPMDDHRGSAAYRRAMIGKLCERFYAESQLALQEAAQ
jgi:xanthine dehydrogenase small subunit